MRTGSFAKAAQNLQISRPAVSAQIRALEQELGHPLFTREGSSTRVKLTPAGELTFSVASKILQGVEYLSAQLGCLHEDKTRYDQVITMAANTTMGIYLLPKLICHFHARHPRFRVRMVVEWDANTLITGFRQGEYDLAVVPAQFALPDARVELAFSQPLTLVANSAMPNLTERHHPVVEWGALPLVLPLGTTLVRRVIDSYFESLGIRPSVVLEASHPEAIKSVLRTTPVAGITHRIGVQEDIASGYLVELRPSRELPSITYLLMRPSSREDHEGVRWLIEFLKGEIPRRAS